MKRVLILGLLAVLIALTVFRFAPTDPDRWHVALAGDADRDMPGGVFRIVEDLPNGLVRLHVIATQAPRTDVLAGSVPEGMVTYVTRSRVFGFPDYTTAQQDGDTLRIHGRLRFGRSDFGVNRDRVDGWLDALKV
ncbi:DUF1499 domain-containing protein [Ruegeria profundi]|uniref:DUF1499 domain-containing protein n=1 Tax=Ruegeria profundi TaxID=1685378 RepID=UPI0009E6CADD|nr:DUF1499 domain-containing protein [Ruegeria profundi]